MRCRTHLLASASPLQIEVLYTGGCSAEHLIGSTDDKGCWLDGLLVRRLRALVEGVRGGACTTAKRSRHRACGVGTGDVCLPPAGKATSGFSHGCRSRLLVLDGPISRVLEGILASDHAGGPPLTGPEVMAEPHDHSILSLCSISSFSTISSFRSFYRITIPQRKFCSLLSLRPPYLA